MSKRYSAAKRVHAGYVDEVSNNLSQLSQKTLAWLGSQNISRKLKRKIDKRLRKSKGV